jgi:mandelamide amidase
MALLSANQANPVPVDAYRSAIDEYRPQLQKAYRDYFKRHAVDAVVFPTTPLPARPIEGSEQTVALLDREVPTFLTYIRNVDPSSNAGIPGLSIPMGKSIDGLAVGLEIETPAHQDKKLLAIGKLLEGIVGRK